MPHLLNPTEQAWTKPEISPKDPTDLDMGVAWRIRFRYYHAGKWRQVTRTSDINTFTTFQKRLSEAKGLKKALRFKLEKQGWNPVTDTYATEPDPLSDVDQELARLKLMGFNEALDFALAKKKVQLSKKSHQDYTSKVKYLKASAISMKLHQKQMNLLELPHFRLILDKTKAIRKFTNQGYNSYRDCLSSLVTEMIQWYIVKENRVFDVNMEKVVKKLAHRPQNNDEKILIVNQIRQRHIFYFRFICILYGCSIRPKEITRLKIKDFIRDEQIFRITPNLAEENSKTLTEREIAIPDWLMIILDNMHLHLYDPNWYIFSCKNEIGHFLPGPVHMHSNTPHSNWKRLIKNPPNKKGTGGLGLNIDQYGLKKLFGNDMVKIQRLAGTDRLLELPAAQMGHSSTKMTEVYVDQHLEEMRKVVKRDMPALWKN